MDTGSVTTTRSDPMKSAARALKSKTPGEARMKLQKNTLERLREELTKAEVEEAAASDAWAEKVEAIAEAAASEALNGHSGATDQARAEMDAAGQRVVNAQALVKGLRRRLQRAESTQREDELAQAWLETEQIASGPMADDVRKMQAGAELIIAGITGFRENYKRLFYEVIPVKPQSWPTFWDTDYLHGYLKQYIGARSEFMHLPDSEAYALREGPDLVTRHKEAVRELLGDSRNDKAA